MPTFVHPALLWGLPILGVPVVIHLITVLRHRRVEWAAMEFLLASQKRNRTRVLLKQLLLLLVRMLAVAMIVLVLAEPILRDRLGGLLGDAKTRHIVLLDDSFSMSDRRADTSAFEQAKRVVERIGTQASRQSERQTFTLLRFSQAGTQPDLVEETIDADFPHRLHATLESIEASHTAAGPAGVLEAIVQLLSDSDGDRSIVYLVSDFRARQWDEAADLRRQLAELTKRDAKLHLINCVEAERANLAVAGLSVGTATRAAGVPAMMEVTVQNFSPAPVSDVPVLLEADGFPQPAVTIARIPPGGAVKARFPVQFAASGEHVITARLETDAVAVDNFRYCVAGFPEAVPVLLIDGDPEGRDARYLSAALAPGGPVPTGIRPQTETPRYLSLHPLDPFQTIYLLNVGQLDESAIEAVEGYVCSGGGVGVFLGEQCRSRFINEALYREGEGFFPVPLAGQAELLVDRLQRAPDLEVGSHPLFRVFAGRRNSFLSTVIVQRYFAVPDDWEPEPDSTTRVIARLRNKAPLAVERDYGEGRVVAVLTSAAPTWNNWARGNPSFVVAMLELQAYLARRPADERSHLVGTPIRLQLDPSQFEAQVRVSTPGGDAGLSASIDAIPAPDGLLAVRFPATERSGICEAALTRKDGTQEVRRYAVNVEAEEGDLGTLAGPELAQRLRGVDYEYHRAAMFEYSADQLAGYNLSRPLLYLLVLLLVGEQLLAWSAGYHPSPRERASGRGGAGR
jgi:hypothetical protein